MNIDRIREAIIKHRPSAVNYTDQQIMKLWDSIDGDTRHNYLESTRTLKKKGNTNADFTETKLEL